MATLATICYLDNGREFLMLHRNKKENDVHHGKWIGVGGKIEQGETPEECARREIFEETGLVAHSLLLKGIITFPHFTPNEDWYAYVFCVRDFSGEMLASCPEGELHWVAYDQVLKKPTWEGDRVFLSWLLEGAPFFSAKFSYEGERCLGHQVVFYGEKGG